MSRTRYLAIDPTTAGFAYVVFESPDRLVEWGLATGRDNAAWIKRLEGLIGSYAPEVIVTENPEESHRGKRAIELLDAVQTIALLRSLWTVRVPKRKVWESFPDAANKHDIAVSLVERFPELRPRLPRKRKAWNSEDARMRIFDALALLLSHLAADPHTS
jgi:hypothetical protein